MKNSVSAAIVFFSFLLILVLPNSGQAQGEDASAIDMVIVLDRSGSMNNTDPQDLSVPAASFVLEQLALANDQNRAAVVPFGDEAQILGLEGAEIAGALSGNLFGLIEMLRASRNSGAFQFKENSPDDPQQLHNLLTSQMRVDGSKDTELGKALDLAGSILEGSQQRKIIVLISDGAPWPNFSDATRQKEVAALVGGPASKTSEFLKKFAQHILATTVKSLADRNISVYPVAFLKREGVDSGLIAYLEDIKEMTTGDREIISATSADLVEKLIDFVPSTSEHIQLDALKGKRRFARGDDQEETKEVEIIVPDIASQVRFFFSYPGARTEHKVLVELFRDGRKMADNRGPNSSGVVFNDLRLKNEELAYHSFRFLQEDAVSGNWRLKLTDKSRGGAARLPDTDVLIDIRARIDLETTLDTDSGQLNAQEPVTFRFRLFGRKGGEEYLLPIHGADIFLVGRGPEPEVSRFADKLRALDFSQPVALAQWKEGFPLSGNYRLRGRLEFQTDPPTSPLAVRFEKQVEVLPGPEVDAWIGKVGTPQSLAQRNPALSFALPSLGENFTAEFTGAELETNIYRPINSLTVIVESFTNQETGSQLEHSWVEILPRKIKGLSVSRPAPLKLVVTLPEMVPAKVADGVYQSRLVLRQGIREIDAVPLSISMQIPRFVQSSEEANIPYTGLEKVEPFRVEHFIRYPGESPHPVAVEFLSTSLPGGSVKPYFEIKEGLTYQPEQDQFSYGNVQARNSKVLYEVADGSYAIPGKNSSERGRVDVRVTLIDESLDGQSFENTLQIMGTFHRMHEAKIITHIRFIPQLWLQWAGGFLLVLAALFGWRGFGLFRNRGLFLGAMYSGDDSIQVITYSGNTLGQFSYDQDANALSYSPGMAANSTRFERIDVAHQQVNDQQVNEYGYEPEEGDTLFIEHARFRLELSINETPNETRQYYGFSIIDSPFEWSRCLLYAGLAAIFSLAAVLQYLMPYAVVRFFL